MGIDLVIYAFDQLGVKINHFWAWVILIIGGVLLIGSGLIALFRAFSHRRKPVSTNGGSLSKLHVHIEQENPINSPNVIGYNNVVTLGETPALQQRTLSEKQQTMILETLNTYPPSEIILIAWPSKESQSYLSYFSTVLVQAGWKARHLVCSPRPAPHHRIRIGWKGDSPTIHFRIFSEALSKADIEFDSESYESDVEESVSLDVGVIPATDRQFVFDRLD